MSAALKARTTVAASPRTPLRTPLSLVPQRRKRPARAPFIAVVVALLASGLLGLLALNTVLAQDAFRLHELQAEGRVLADREQALLTAVEDLQAPSALAGRAIDLGMVPGGPPAFLRLPDGAVLGAGTPGVAPTPGPDSAPVAPGVETDATAAAPADQEPAPKTPAGGTSASSSTDSSSTDSSSGTAGSDSSTDSSRDTAGTDGDTAGSTR